MSAFFCTDGLASLPININAEYAYTARKFFKKPKITPSPNYKASLFLTYSQTKKLPNRKHLYRNHFTMFLNRMDFEILICRTETTQLYADNDAIILYQRIGLSKNENMRFTNTDISGWAVSFDKEITYSTVQPRDFNKFELLCSGEWWYFDRGVILNGLTRYIKCKNAVGVNSGNYEGADVILETCNAQSLPLIANLCKNIFIYYELYPELEINNSKSTKVTPQPPPPPPPPPPPALSSSSSSSLFHLPPTEQTNEMPSQMIKVVSHDHLGFLQKLLQTSTDIPNSSNIKFSSINPKITPIANSVAEGIMNRANDNTQTPTMTYQNVIPTRFWFLERSREFKMECIDYFTTIGPLKRLI